ncbi:MAG: hypothetical protein JWQ90_1788 [Hydrocarboniphaga sp.]|nr:hypothetical protein [Hydrocarboniphaga sp.]
MQVTEWAVGAVGVDLTRYFGLEGHLGFGLIADQPAGSPAKVEPADSGSPSLQPLSPVEFPALFDASTVIWDAPSKANSRPCSETGRFRWV